MMMRSNLLTPKGLRPYGALPASMFLNRSGGKLAPVNGAEAFPLRDLGLIPGVGGGDRGYNAAGDIITETQNGVSLNDLWNDYQDMLREFNAKRDTLLNFLTWRTTAAREDDINRDGALVDFEEATEYGEPVGVRPRIPTSTSLGYTFKFFDVAARYTWQFLANADSQQVDTIADQVAEADNRLMFRHVLTTLFNPVRRINREGNNVYPFYAGAVGDKPPDVGTTTFADSHNHYVTTNSATLTPAHLESLQTLLTEHGYKRSAGYTIIVLINDGDTTENRLRQFRSIAQINPSTPDATHGNFDFVPAQGTSPLLLPTDVRLSDNGVVRPPATIAGMEVVGAYDQMVFVKNSFVPAGYLAAFATGGQESVQNPVAIREHPNQSLRGLRLVKGKTPDYPLIDSFWLRGFGTGIRRRGAGAVLQVVASATYTAPAAYNAW
jgi:hypothetical protein